MVRRAKSGTRVGAAARGPDAPPMFQPFRLRDLELKNRVIVSAMDMYSATDGLPDDFHLVNTGSKALGGAALVMTEMVCVSPEGRITPGCAGMYRPEHEAGWRRVVDFVHRAHERAHRSAARPLGPQRIHEADVGGHRRAAPRCELGGLRHPRRSPTRRPTRCRASSPPRRWTTIRDAVRAAAEAGDRAGFDMLELHCAHGYLLSSFISPITNQRTDAYGGIARSPPALPARGVRRRARCLAARTSR